MLGQSRVFPTRANTIFYDLQIIGPGIKFEHEISTANFHRTEVFPVVEFSCEVRRTFCDRDLADGEGVGIAFGLSINSGMRFSDG